MTGQAFVTPILPNISARRRPAVCRRPRRIFFCTAGPTDLYEVLEVAKDADATTIKRAYRRAALKNHPDVSKAADAQERFLRVQEAYSVLSDPSKRAEYDRRVRLGQPFSADSPWPGGSSGTGFNPEEYMRNWREKNPMPSDLNDSFGSIFSDLFSGVASAVNSTSSSGSKRSGVMEDFVDFLEKQVEGFGVDSSGFASKDDDDGLRDILRSSDVDVLQAEIEDARFVLEQLEARKAKLDQEVSNLKRRADEWDVRADRAEQSRDYPTRDAAKDRQTELSAEAKRWEERARKTKSHIDKQKERLTKIEKRLEAVRAEQSNQKRSSIEKNISAREKAKDTKRKAVDEELERMKRELGL